MRLIFVEYYWQVEEISKNKEKFINDIIISLYHEIIISLYKEIIISYFFVS